jgi:hypothetical protein
MQEEAPIRRFIPLVDARNLKGIHRLLDEHPELITDPESAAWMLHRTAKRGDIAIVRLLLDRGVDVNVFDHISKTYVSWSAMITPSTELMRLLIERGAIVNWRVLDSAESL